MRLIDADALIKRLEEWNTDDPTDKAMYNFTMHRINEQPTIEPERKKGEWLPIIDANELGEPYQSGVYCSECGETEPYEYCFCHTCGADMRNDGDTE